MHFDLGQQAAVLQHSVAAAIIGLQEHCSTAKQEAGS